MIAEGQRAPTFELPAVVEGEVETVALEAFLGDQVVVLAFYPGDFNEVQDEESAGLDTLDVFTMQKDVVVLGISGDSVSSHQAFAEAFDLNIPLLADVHGEVARDYGVYDEDATHPTRQAVFVVDLDGTVEYAWAASEDDEAPDVRPVRAAFEAIGSDVLAAARYEAGYEQYASGRTALTDGLGAYQDNEWMDALAAFERATDHLEAANDAFDTAARFHEDERLGDRFESAESVTGELLLATEWFHEATDAMVKGETMRGEQLEADAQEALERAEDVGEPADPATVFPERAVGEATDGDERGQSTDSESRAAASGAASESDDPLEAGTETTAGSDGRPEARGEADGDQPFEFDSESPGRGGEDPAGKGPPDSLPDWEEMGDDIDVEGETLDLPDPTAGEESGNDAEAAEGESEESAGDDETTPTAGEGEQDGSRSGDKSGPSEDDEPPAEADPDSAGDTEGSGE